VFSTQWKKFSHCEKEAILSHNGKNSAIFHTMKKNVFPGVEKLGG
jgi:hypothetical protein